MHNSHCHLATAHLQLIIIIIIIKPQYSQTHVCNTAILSNNSGIVTFLVFSAIYHRCTFPSPYFNLTTLYPAQRSTAQCQQKRSCNNILRSTSTTSVIQAKHLVNKRCAPYCGLGENQVIRHPPVNVTIRSFSATEIARYHENTTLK
jgi:hypothetical protein